MATLLSSIPAARVEPQWSLVAHNEGDVLPLRTFPCQIGRQPGLPVRIVHPTVSLVHAEFHRAPAGLTIVDLGSRNGTFVNGKRIVTSSHVNMGDLVQFGAAVFRIHNQANQDISATCQSEDVGDLALALAQFDKLMNESAVRPFYQPIVSVGEGRPVAYEALARSPLYGLGKPEQMFQAAKYFEMEAELSRLLRRAGLSVSSAQSCPHLFLNTHPAELSDIKTMVLSLREIRQARPTQPITLEVHEAAAADISVMKLLRMVLTDLNMRLAYDDFGAGQARLNELVEAKPDYLKFDRKLICGLDGAGPHRLQLIASLVQMSRQLGIITLAEGVETAAEADVCHKLGFELMQGFYFGRPAAGPPPATTEDASPAASDTA